MQTQLQGLEELARQSRINYTTVVDTVYYDYFANMVCIFTYTLKTQFSEHGFSEILDLINKLPLSFSYLLYSLSRLDLVNSLNLVNNRVFTKSSLGCKYN